MRFLLSFYRSGDGVEAGEQDRGAEAVPDGEVRVEVEAVRQVALREPLPSPAQAGTQQLAAAGKERNKESLLLLFLSLATFRIR